MNLSIKISGIPVYLNEIINKILKNTGIPGIFKYYSNKLNKISKVFYFVIGKKKFI